MANDEISRKVRLTLLSAFYGPLLTEKQQRVLSLFCEDDMSVSEIAACENVTKQCIHETLQCIGTKLDQLEANLGLAKKFSRIEESLIVCKKAICEGRSKDALDIIDNIILLNQEEENGI